MTSERNSVIPAAYLFVKHENTVLLQRRFNTGFQDGQYTFISGHVERDESPDIAICREALEEAGIIVQPEDLHFEQVLYRKSAASVGQGFANDAPERVDFFFSTERWQGTPHITEPNKCDDLRWFPMDALPTNMFSIVREFLSQYPLHEHYGAAGYQR